ncbi:MAG TPA: phage holin family protein [Acidimicrobiales bacterium]|jgi:membrane protein implicated in regulation of membrane protease activity|nr:phage holin family protein [Acidimicrobiales bacterium]
MAYRTEERSLSELLSDVTTEIATLFRKEVELAKAETSEQVSRAAKAGGMLGAAAVIGFLDLILFSFALAWALSEVVPEGVAFAIVGVLFAVVAGVLAMAGKKRLANVNPVPNQTVQTLKEDVQVAKDSFTRGVR